ncbi:hypothetical protein BTA51_19615 [Hahella sp. CCB-MM4]|uniref:AHH domain-containing protein n=1 Tax=Hahella sp. (strain CCB-MM4) TaxID=1926491 RepID=UPI000B9C46B2|nr:hypothetical protein BTA51_19615 [Hahella sp. CCB-MM4]
MIPFINPNQTSVERLLIDFAQKVKPTIADFQRLKTLGPLYDRLARNMRRAGEPRPSKHCDCHAIVSGAHSEAVLVRGVLAWLGMRIDDPHNGCWLPKDWKDRLLMPNHLRNAVPHRRIHHSKYYEWLNQVINADMITTADELIHALRMVRTMLQSGNVPPNVMPQTGR